MEGSLHPAEYSVVGDPEGYLTIVLDDAESLVLPPADTKRWSSRRKAAVVVAIRGRVITRERAQQRYMLSDEELASWEAAFDKRGIRGLRATSRLSSRALRGITARSRPVQGLG